MATLDTATRVGNPGDIGFYNIDASTLKEPARKLLNEYSGIPKEEIDDHVNALVCLMKIKKLIRHLLLILEKQSILNCQYILHNIN